MADKFRRKKEPRHIRLYHSITGTEAWHHLSGNAVKVLIALARLDDGRSNGEIYFSERTAAETANLSRNTAKRCLRELIDKGFIAQTKPGAFNRNNLLAATYRLTWVAWPGGKPAAPTRDFEKWKHGNSQAQILTRSGSISDSNVETQPEGGSNSDSASTGTSDVSTFAGGSKTKPQVLYQGEGNAEPETAGWKQAIPASGPDLGDLRQQVVDHLKRHEVGEQSQLAQAVPIPASTLSKFLNGRSLPEQYRAPLAEAVAIY